MAVLPDSDPAPESAYEEARRLLEEAIRALGQNITQTRDYLGPVLLPEQLSDGDCEEGDAKGRVESELVTWIRVMAATVRNENTRLRDVRDRIQL